MTDLDDCVKFLDKMEIKYSLMQCCPNAKYDHAKGFNARLTLMGTHVHLMFRKNQYAGLLDDTMGFQPRGETNMDEEL